MKNLLIIGSVLIAGIAVAVVTMGGTEAPNVDPAVEEAPAQPKLRRSANRPAAPAPTRSVPRPDAAVQSSPVVVVAGFGALPARR